MTTCPSTPRRNVKPRPEDATAAAGVASDADLIANSFGKWTQEGSSCLCNQLDLAARNAAASAPPGSRWPRPRPHLEGNGQAARRLHGHLAAADRRRRHQDRPAVTEAHRRLGQCPAGFSPGERDLIPPTRALARAGGVERWRLCWTHRSNSAPALPQGPRGSHLRTRPMLDRRRSPRLPRQQRRAVDRRLRDLWRCYACRFAAIPSSQRGRDDDDWPDERRY